MSRHDANRLTYDEVMIFGIPALFTDLRAAFEKYRAQLKNKARSHAKKRAEPER